MDGTQGIDTLGSTGRLSVLARVYASASAAAPLITIKLFTAMTPSPDAQDWVEVASNAFAPGGSGDTVKIDVSDLLLRYVRWDYTGTNVTSAVVEITGVLW
ncbi:MAG: hypothetical protein JNK72_04400 [Myxococcales bacterium]|nr:hypothetical protein [Myxococcales bacterium]